MKYSVKYNDELHGLGLKDCIIECNNNPQTLLDQLRLDIAQLYNVTDELYLCGSAIMIEKCK